MATIPDFTTVNFVENNSDTEIMQEVDSSLEGWRTPEGIDVKRLYSESEVENLDF